MMFKSCFVGAALLWACLNCVNLHAGILASHLVQGENKLVDESRELFIKGANNSGPGIEAGDILIGFARIDEALPGNTLPSNSAYAVFSQTFTALTAVANDPGFASQYRFGFTATTQAGFTLADLLGVASPAILDPTSMIAIVSGQVSAFTRDLTVQSVVDVNVDSSFDIFDSFALLANEGNVDAVFGLLNPAPSGPPGSLDFFRGTTSDQLALNQDFVADLANLANITDPNTTLANFTGFLSLVYDRPDAAIITSGANILSGSVTLPGAGQNVDGSFTFVNKADFVFSAQIVPEPMSSAVWAILGLSGCVFARRRTAV